MFTLWYRIGMRTAKSQNYFARCLKNLETSILNSVHKKDEIFWAPDGRRGPGARKRLLGGSYLLGGLDPPPPGLGLGAALRKSLIRTQNEHMAQPPVLGETPV